MGRPSCTGLGCSLVGTFFFGWCADRHGRWTVALACAFINAACGVLSSTAGRFWVLIAFRGAVGFSLGGTMQPYVMLLEYLPARTRGSWAMLCSSMAWVLGSMFVYAIAWAVLSSSIAHATDFDLRLCPSKGALRVC